MKRFLPVADEVGRLQRGKDAECLLFQAMAEHGHYAGRTTPSDTRQGIYALTPSGDFLASCNTRRADDVVRMLDLAWAAWEELEPAHRTRDVAGDVRRFERLYPIGGLALRVISRDLDGATCAESWHETAWNQDFAWFTAEEARSLVPATDEVGASLDWPQALVDRLARLHLVDNVRGQTSPFARDALKDGRLISTITAVDGDRVAMSFEGALSMSQEGTWSIGGFADADAATRRSRSMDATLLGRATFDRAQERFVEFQAVVVGTRTGGTQFNQRAQDLGPSTIGFAFDAVPDEPRFRVAPAHIWDYGWLK
ncbi:MAG: hypothetical protein IPH13_22100 [Planctomycetes bacterium]|nr:hypothetical protein [Planctomycetota bacterium]